VMVTHEHDIAAHAERTICVRDGKVVNDGHCAETGQLSLEQP
jgi:ABC-type lipoprotein export system ATPase subunit